MSRCSECPPIPSTPLPAPTSLRIRMALFEWIIMINIRGVSTPSIFSHNKHSNPLAPALAYATSLPSMSRGLLLLVGHVPTVLGRSTVRTSPGALRGCEQPRASAVARCVRRG